MIFFTSDKAVPQLPHGARRWALGAMMLGFSAAIALWTFELGVSIAGLDKDAKRELISGVLGADTDEAAGEVLTPGRGGRLSAEDVRMLLG